MSLIYMINDFITFVFLGVAFLMVTELRYSLKWTVVCAIVAVAILFIAYAILMSKGVNEGLAAAVSLSLPSLLICFVLSKHKDSRFIYILQRRYYRINDIFSGYNYRYFF